VRSILHAFPRCSEQNGPSSDTLRRVDGIIVASTMQTRPDNTTLECSSISNKKRGACERRYADCRVKSRRAVRALRAASRSASRPFTALGHSSRDTRRTRRHEIIMVIEHHRSRPHHGLPHRALFFSTEISMHKIGQPE